MGPYRKAISDFRTRRMEVFDINDRTYECVKIRRNDDEIHYIYFSDALRREQIIIKNQKFLKELKKNKPLLYRTKAGKPLGQYSTEEGIVIAKGILQKRVEENLSTHISMVLRDTSYSRVVLMMIPNKF
ncbi:MAG: hypothetical protein AB1779_07540 [Candidatus Thermoplasmatota archaeon]